MKVLVEENLANVYVTSDHHFRHENIIKHCNRPFANVADMDKTLIDNWNKVVRPQDWAIHLGDFTLDSGPIAQEYFAQLNGNICILSNPWHHDKRWLRTTLPLKTMSGFDVKIWPSMVILEVPQIGKNGYPLAIHLCHYPMAVWDRKHYGAWHFHGHSHGNYQHATEIDYGKVALDIGVDCHNFTPISLGDIAVMFDIPGGVE